ncbi:MAG TPA: flagellar biosynthesis protein FlhB [Rhizobiaceae bacterium]|nr:flagellar biosynthesis protein FlhB [Rhizobiaceae bacterium]
MADAPDKDSKTEEATEKKIRDTIEKGQLPHSKEAATFASFVAILAFTVFFAKDSAVDLSVFLATFLEKPEAWPLDTEADVVLLYQVIFVHIGKALVAIMLLLFIAGIGASVVQHMPAFVLDRITPKASRISLSQGWTRLFGLQGFVEFAKSLAKLIFTLIVLIFALGEAHISLLSGMITPPAAFGMVIRDMAIDILSAVTFVMLVIAAVDFVWSRFHWRMDLRMTKQEVKDEHKQSDGDPLVKARLRSIARDRARNRMMTAVPKATLVIANPTHYAIALKYVRDQDAAPVVLAKGTDLVALKIREIAEANGIPVFEDVTLARSMYKQVSVDNLIPPQFYHAVAELVKVVYANSKPQRKGA